ncbi:MAG: redox-regulated ATPase YchF [Desulfobacteraceae bacterium]|nr:MAG: redox-regulated ATPase YchF [Desulfobacteraceae bacterium]
MKLGITGLSAAGKSTVFEALTQNVQEEGHKVENRVGTIEVPDSRVKVLSDMYKPVKTIFAKIEYYLPAIHTQKSEAKKEQNIWTPVRDCDALIHVVRNFSGYGLEVPTPYKDFFNLDQELILADLVTVEKRIERIEADKKRGKKTDQEEFTLLMTCLENLEKEIPLRRIQEIASAQVLKGFAFVSAKPVLVLFNNNDDDSGLPEAQDLIIREECMVIRGKLEQELSRMSPEEAGDFLTEYGIKESARERVIKKSYELLGLISFFTVGEDEVRAWTIKKETKALDAAEVIHSDIKKGFIRAEVVSYNDLMDAGTYPEARKRGTVRLEGKTYLVQDGDIINFRFNV